MAMEYLGQDERRRRRRRGAHQRGNQREAKIKPLSRDLASQDHRSHCQTILWVGKREAIRWTLDDNEEQHHYYPMAKQPRASSLGQSEALAWLEERKLSLKGQGKT